MTIYASRGIAIATKRPKIREERQWQRRNPVDRRISPSLATQVERYVRTVAASMSKAIAALVRLGFDGHEARKREFFGRLKDNLANDDPEQQDRLGDEFRMLILGH